jgi:hypothetical protein
MHTASSPLPNYDSDSSSSHDNSFSNAVVSMSTTTPAECLHAEPRWIPLLTPGVVTPMVVCQWEMACANFFKANKKLEVNDRVAAVLLGLKDMQAQDWVTTHGNHLSGLTFSAFIVELQKEFLPDGQDDELHAKICNMCLKSLGCDTGDPWVFFCQPVPASMNTVPVRVQVWLPPWVHAGHRNLCGSPRVSVAYYIFSV